MLSLALGANSQKSRKGLVIFISVVATFVMLDRFAAEADRQHQRESSLQREAEWRATERFVDEWLEQALNYWSESSAESHNLAGAKMSPQARAQFAKLFWSSKRAPSVARALVFRSMGHDLYGHDKEKKLRYLTVKGLLVSYESNDALRQIRLDFTLRETANGRVIQLVEVRDLDGGTSLKEFIDDACREHEINVSKDAILLYEEGAKQFYNANFEGAISAFRLALVRCPRFALAQNAIGEALHSRSASKALPVCLDEIAAFRAACALNPELIPAHLGIARYCSSIGADSAALLEYVVLAEKIPRRAELWALRGYSLDRVGRGPEAVQSVDRAIRLDPNNALAKAFLAWTKYTVGDAVESERPCREAIRLNSNCGMAYFCLGRLELDDNRNQMAIWNFDNAIRCSPEIKDVYGYRAWCYERLGHECLAKKDAAASEHYERAIADYDKAIQHDPLNARHHMDRGWARNLIKDFDGALADLTTAIELDSTLSLARMMRGEIYRGLGYKEKSFADKIALLAIAPTKPSDYNVRFMCQREMGDKDGAINSLSKYLELNPVHHGPSALERAYYERAILRFEVADYVDSLSDLLCGLRYWKIGESSELTDVISRRCFPKNNFRFKP